MITSVVTVICAALAAVTLLILGLSIVLLALAVMVDGLPQLGEMGRWVAPIFALLTVVVVWHLCRMLISIVRRDARFGIRWARATRLAHFAEANGLIYIPELRDPPPIGLVFTAGARRRLTDVVAGSSAVPFEIGNYEYAGGSHEDRLRRYGYMCVDLPRSLPHMMLVAHANRRSFSRTNLPWRLPRDQVLSLGAPLEEHFTLYCPSRYHDDAMYVLTPKLVALLVERARNYDVEIIDDRMILYSAKRLDMTAPATYALLGDLIATVGLGAIDRAELYRDPRVEGPFLVAVEGRRLELRRPVLARVIGVFALVYLAARLMTLVLGIGV